MIIRRIELLDPQLANKIAAGEVVERPASVVKELVENSLDAGASSVTVEIREGGTEYVRVTDNGCGIPNEDVKTAFLRHATSKLHSIEGLDGIETLGFRGEALASIASVARVCMRTRTEEDECGTLISIDGGKIKQFDPCGCPVGTNIEVRELFYNVPARLKFLRSSRAEAAAVGDYVMRLILGSTRVSFKFINNGKPVYHSAGDGSLENALICVYGSEIAEHIKPVHYDDGYVLIDGYCGDETISKSNRIQQSIYINGRYIRSQQISYAAQRAYSTRLMVGRFPFLVLNTRLSPREVDVNVHPNKLTVRFRDEERISSAVMIAVKEALEGGTLSELNEARNASTEIAPAESCAPDMTALFHSGRSEADREVLNSLAEEASGGERADDIASDTGSRRAESAAAAVKGEPAAPAERSDAESAPFARPVYVRDSASSAPASESLDSNSVLHYDFMTPSEQSIERTEAISFGLRPYTVVGVVFDTYIVVEQEDSVFFIDQHAAHERINYEKLIRGELRFDSQLLLTSEIIRLSPTEFAILAENMERFGELGFEIDEFGPLSVSVQAVPAGIKKESIEKLLHDMIAVLERQGSISELDVVRGSLIQASCKHAVKAGQALSSEEIDEILGHYADGSTPLTCPHGRPVMIRFTKRDFEKMFKRIV